MPEAGVMVSTSDFGSESIGSSPVPPTFFIYINKVKLNPQLPLLVKVGVFFLRQL